MVSSTASEDRAASYDQEVAFAGELDFAKLLKMEASRRPDRALEKSAGAIRGRTRTRTPSFGPQATFSPRTGSPALSGGSITFGLEYETPELFGIKEFAHADAAAGFSRKRNSSISLSRSFL